MPIRRYAVQKDKAINKYYEFYSASVDDDDIVNEFNSFISKVNILDKIRGELLKKGIVSNRLIYECIFWANKIIDVETGKDNIFTDSLIQRLVEFIGVNIDKYTLLRSSFAKELIDRYIVTSRFFEKEFQIDFHEYLHVTDEFKGLDKKISKDIVKDDTTKSFETLRINKPEPSSITIEDISRQMKRQRFLIRPPYQRFEVINKRKSSAIIESIILGIKIPPIFIFKRKDGISEVVDGQQRLLSIIGFIGESYLDEKNKLSKSQKDGYSLSLKNGILTDFHGKKFKDFSQNEKDKILEYDLWIIEIDGKNNEDFDQIDLFIRFNYKPYPIKENTFEMWNSYVDRDIISVCFPPLLGQ